MKMDRIEHEKRKWYVVRDTLAKMFYVESLVIEIVCIVDRDIWRG